MARRRDPVETAATDEVDLQEVSTWEPRTPIDRLAVAIYGIIAVGIHGVVLLVAVTVTAALLATPAIVLADDPVLSVFLVLSIVPAALLAAYIWYADITTQEPLALLVGTFLLAMLFATFAAVVNSAAALVLQTATLFGAVVFFYLVVAPAEETVKLLAVRVFAYRSRSFDAVIDGAVYGAVAGLGFAAIENALYITRHVAQVGPEAGVITAATGITTIRMIVGPGHVIFSAIAGYYLGLAKFTPEHAGPLVVKGLFLASLAHGTYNVTVQFAPDFLALATPLGPNTSLIAYVIAFDLLVAYYLYRRIVRYRRTYRAVHGQPPDDPTPEPTEFDGPLE